MILQNKTSSDPKPSSRFGIICLCTILLLCTSVLFPLLYQIVSTTKFDILKFSDKNKRQALSYSSTQNFPLVAAKYPIIRPSNKNLTQAISYPSMQRLYEHNLPEKNNGKNRSCTRIVVPFIASQSYLIKGFLDSWTKLPACSVFSSCIDLHFMLDLAPESASNESQLMALSSNVSSALKRLSNNSMVSCLRGSSFSVFRGGSDNYFIGSYVALKSLLWETHLQGYGCMAMMELDVYPIKQNWLDHVHKMCYLDGDFLMKGTAYTACEDHHPDYGHINGNCLWNVKNWSVLDESFGVFQDNIGLLEYFPAGYDVLLRHLFVRPGNVKLQKDVWKKGVEKIRQKYGEPEAKSWFEYFTKWKHGVAYMYKNLSNPVLTNLWSRGYNSTPYIINDIPSKRPYCTDLSLNHLNFLQENHPDHLFVHCSQNNPQAKDQTKTCIHVTVPFTLSEILTFQRFLSRITDPSMPACGKQAYTCIHFHFVLKVLHEDRITVYSNILGQMIDEKMFEVPCIQHHDFSIVRFERKYLNDPYAFLKYTLPFSAKLGYKYVFLMEPNIRPIQYAWLETLYEVAYYEREFSAIKGTARDDVPEYNENYMVINQNCFWNIEEYLFLNETFNVLDKYIHLIDDLQTTYDVLLRHIFIRPINEALMNVSDPGGAQWKDALTKVYADLQTSPLIKIWADKSFYDHGAPNFLLMPSAKTKRICSDHNQANQNW
eukprot:CAMPEP_0117800606 /NCGR_PEP_ID=MMETSP0948-20121206/14563_1 /TAXON_ID=44440 /ORGANISM="Chattonella subsalsa, Strain CCMP2191" /LENGTH=712 /DNA_ID=CAMNT_0005632903 /DNA_START=36 /DNA_END=2171 /DNA_ORIENTATION=+